jgi:mannose-6-phosphate isomerase-like protein (cupin superfamily)
MADPRLDEIAKRPENEIFRVVFYPDRIYHAQYLNATRSERYKYTVHEVRGKHDIRFMKGAVRLDGQKLANFVRIEYSASRLVEASRARVSPRLAQDEIIAWVRLLPDGLEPQEAFLKMHLCRWTDTYQVEVWTTLATPPTVDHDFSVLDQMGRDQPITCVPTFNAILNELSALRRVELAFRENDRDQASGGSFDNPSWDNNFLSSHQEPRVGHPSSSVNTVEDKNYLLDFRRGYFLDARNTAPVRYINAMMDEDNPDRGPDNIIEMRWLLQREFGGSVIFFHEVTIPPKTVEGTHRHVGSEELYYVVSGRGTAYMARGDDPDADALYPEVQRHIFGIGRKSCTELPVEAGNVIFTKSGGIHGIRNDGDVPLKFVAFLYHSS